MAFFKDKSDRRWDVELTIAVARRTFDISKPEEITAILDDPYKRFDLLWLICEPQATAAEIDANDFDLLVSDESTYVAANEALLESIESFFRRIGKESLALLMSKTREAALSIDKMATEKVSTMALTQVITKAGEQIDRAIAKVGSLPSSSLESSESTQTL